MKKEKDWFGWHWLHKSKKLNAHGFNSNDQRTVRAGVWMRGMNKKGELIERVSLTCSPGMHAWNTVEHAYDASSLIWGGSKFRPSKCFLCYVQLKGLGENDGEKTVAKYRKVLWYVEIDPVKFDKLRRLKDPVRGFKRMIRKAAIKKYGVEKIGNMFNGA